MIANSTQISNRMFRSQRIILLAILGAFLVLLGITGFSGHHNMVMESMKTASNTAGDKLAGIYNGYTDKSSSEQEEAAALDAVDGKAEANKLANLAKEKQDQAKEDKEAKHIEKLEEEQIGEEHF